MFIKHSFVLYKYDFLSLNSTSYILLSRVGGSNNGYAWPERSIIKNVGNYYYELLIFNLYW